MKGKLIVFTAPSGAGKTTLVKHLLKKIDNLAFSVSATTRNRRKKEIDGKDYYFLTKDEFSKKLENGEFLEHQEVYDGNFYGTLIAEVDRLLNMGKHVIFDVDVEGALSIKKYYGDQALTVFVQAPSVEVLRERLTCRNSESPETLEIRIAKANKENQYASKFDKVVLNDVLEVAKADAYRIVKNFLTSSLLNSMAVKQVIVENV